MPDPFACERDHFTSQRTRKSEIYLLSNDGPTQCIETGRKKRDAQPPSRPHEGGVTAFKFTHIVLKSKNAKSGGVQACRALAANFRIRMNAGRGLAIA